MRAALLRSEVQEAQQSSQYPSSCALSLWEQEGRGKGERAVRRSGPAREEKGGNVVQGRRGRERKSGGVLRRLDLANGNQSACLCSLGSRSKHETRNPRP
jgi:hypothetical protein